MSDKSALITFALKIVCIKPVNNTSNNYCTITINVWALLIERKTPGYYGNTVGLDA